MPIVKFKDAGKWAEHLPYLPQFEVEAGEEREVSHELADVIVDAEKGVIVSRKKSSQSPAKKDKQKAESNRAKKDKQKAESSSESTDDNGII